LKDQFYCNTCYAFSAVAAVEAYVNLYFNNNIGNPKAATNENIKHQIDVDLSETEAVRCQNPENTQTCYSIGFNGDVLNYIQSNGIQDESCLEYSLLVGNSIPPTPPPPLPPMCDDKCLPNQAPEIIQTTAKGLLNSNSEDYIKTNLIIHGPLALKIDDYLYPGYNHCMVLVGYGTATEGDTVFLGDDEYSNPIVLDSMCPF
jgi:hypothetical protein